MLRRFEQFQWGPLNATRLNELVDSITSLQQQVRQMQSKQEHQMNYQKRLPFKMHYKAGSLILCNNVKHGVINKWTHKGNQPQCNPLLYMVLVVREIIISP